MSIGKEPVVSIGEIEAKVRYDYQPAERQTWDYPGCAAWCAITEVEINGQWVTPDHLDADMVAKAEELLLESLTEDPRDHEPEDCND